MNAQIKTLIDSLKLKAGRLEVFPYDEVLSKPYDVGFTEGALGAYQDVLKILDELQGTLGFVEWLALKIASLEEFLGQMINKRYEDEDGEVEIANLQGELRAYKAVYAKYMGEDYHA